MPSASARHILVKTEEEANDLKQQIVDGADFADLASKHSSCPSGKSGGDLGTFEKGAMVPEFDEIVFSDLPIGECSAPVRTQFGFHLLEVNARKD